MSATPSSMSMGRAPCRPQSRNTCVNKQNNQQHLCFSAFCFAQPWHQKPSRLAFRRCVPCCALLRQIWTQTKLQQNNTNNPKTNRPAAARWRGQWVFNAVVRQTWSYFPFVQKTHYYFCLFFFYPLCVLEQRVLLPGLWRLLCRATNREQCWSQDDSRELCKEKFSVFCTETNRAPRKITTPEQER